MRYNMDEGYRKSVGVQKCAKGIHGAKGLTLTLALISFKRIHSAVVVKGLIKITLLRV